MGNNEPQVPPADHLCRPAGAVRMAQSVETVTAHAPFARPLLRHRIGSGRLGQGCVEGRVKRRYLWDLWEDLLDRCNAVQAGRVVERRQLCQFPYRPLDLWRDPHRGGVPLAAVNDAMSHGLEFSEYAQRCRRASLQVVEDASDGISVLFQLQLLADFLMARATENQPRRLCRPVDAALGQQQLAFSFEEAEFEAAGAGVTNQNFHFCLPHGVPCSYPFGLAPNMASVVPEPDYRLRQVVFVAQRTHARRAEHEVSTERGIEAEPASSKYSEKMRARKDQHITLDSAHAFHHAVCPRANLVRRFPSGAAIAKQLPIRALPVDVSGKATLILAIVPFEQVTVDFSHRSKSRQLAGPHRALQRAGKHLGESHSSQPFLKPARIALATFCERQVGKSRVLARERPGGFPVSGQVNDRKRFAHGFTPLVLPQCFDSPTGPV